MGSVVTLKQGDKKLMICGRVQREVHSKRIYDYCACLYPEGMIDSKSVYLFNQEDIDQIFYIGLQDVEEFRFRHHMEEELKKLQMQ
ncbi:DUF4176 domain-containing protein [Merdibacter massiliensis]|uniref:DUF4176 domain-containing protein n=1 Tax=Merdibacter massiliensis TaxID=1871030 RepID=UPI001F2BA07A|nr:DUF4176 domain-containing protein [Merdibacter massiliensis]